MSGIYIHIPFCVKKCVYCDFYSETDLSVEGKFVEALIREIEIVTSGDKKTVDTVYLGGGTPSAVKAESIQRILGSVRRCFDVSDAAEITIEVNPGTMSVEKLADYRKAGINRLNVGVQSFNDRHLKFLGRIHNAKEARFFIKEARKAGFKNIGIDLIYCIPGQTESLWVEDLKAAVSLTPEHLSCYNLTYETGTPLYQLYRNGAVTPSGDTISAALFEKTISYLESNGFLHYEISNFASSPETRSQHNMKYWNVISYNGFGPSAHSFNVNTGRRSWNSSNLSTYMANINSGNLSVNEEELLSEEQKIIEAIFLGLRKTDGIDIKWFNKTFHADFSNLFRSVLSDLTSSDHIIMSNNICRLSKKGLLLADNIASRFIQAI